MTPQPRTSGVPLTRDRLTCHRHKLGGEVALSHDPLATRPRGIRRVCALSSDARDLARIVYRDPEHVPERITLRATERLAESSLAWAQAIRSERPEVEPAVMAEEVRHQSSTVARINGAIAGTPFFVAIVPGCLGYLWQETMMVLRTAALYGRDPRQLTTAAETLSLRGVHPSPEAALAALEAVLAKPLPDKPPRRRALRNWVQSLHMVLVFGGFPRRRPRDHRRAGEPSCSRSLDCCSRRSFSSSRGCSRSPLSSRWLGGARVTRATWDGARTRSTAARQPPHDELSPPPAPGATPDTASDD